MVGDPFHSLDERAIDFFVGMVLRRFFDKADEDYVSARILFLNGFHSSFLWMSQQTLEKYLKCALLLRGKEIQKSHDLKWHLEELTKCEDISFPDVLDAPATMQKLPAQRDAKGNLAPWPFREQLTQAVSKFGKMGASGSRYNEKDFHIEPYDLVKFDIISKLFRDAAKNTEKFILNRDVVDTADSRGRRKFGKMKLSEPAFEYLKKYNYAYWPNEDHGFLFLKMSARFNEAEKAIFENNPSYISASAFLKKLIQDGCGKKSC